jgi:hypothetical protein
LTFCYPTSGELLSELVSELKKSGAKYTVLYASQPYDLLENASNLPLSRYLAEMTNTTTKAGLGECDGECLVKSSLLEGVFVVSCHLDSIYLLGKLSTPIVHFQGILYQFTSSLFLSLPSL